MDFYRSPMPQEDVALEQGDILHPVPFVGYNPRAVYVVEPGAAGWQSRDLTRGAELPVGSELQARVESGTGMILNQSCDLSTDADRQKPLLLARVVPCTERVRDFREDNLRRRVEKIRELANPGRTPNLFYLPERHAEDFRLPRSVVDLLEVTCFPAGSVAAFRKLLRVRLRPVALQALQERMAYCFGRFGTPDDLYFDAEEWGHLQERLAHRTPRPTH